MITWYRLFGKIYRIYTTATHDDASSPPQRFRPPHPSSDEIGQTHPSENDAPSSTRKRSWSLSGRSGSDVGDSESVGSDEERLEELYQRNTPRHKKRSQSHKGDLDGRQEIQPQQEKGVGKQKRISRQKHLLFQSSTSSAQPRRSPRILQRSLETGKRNGQEKRDVDAPIEEER